jgi:hypothetical protein
MLLELGVVLAEELRAAVAEDDDARCLVAASGAAGHHSSLLFRNRAGLPTQTSLGRRDVPAGPAAAIAGFWRLMSNLNGTPIRPGLQEHFENGEWVVGDLNRLNRN